jgi:ABC-type Co2+ transport system permease subunit
MQGVVVTWVCLGGGVVMMLIALVAIRRLQSKTEESEDRGPDSD